MERHVLVIFPHPDDESFAAAGMIAQYTKKGIPVTYACATLGEMGRHMGNPPFANRETLPEIREKELKEACRILGIHDLRLLGMRDKMLEFENPDTFATLIGDIIEEVAPSLIITFYPRHGIHPDHDACAEAVVEAVARLPKENRPRLHCAAIRDQKDQTLGEPDLVVDVTDVLDKKIAAIQAHRTQFEGILSRFAAETNFNHPKLREWLRTEVVWMYEVV